MSGKNLLAKLTRLEQRSSTLRKTMVQNDKVGFRESALAVKYAATIGAPSAASVSATTVEMTSGADPAGFERAEGAAGAAPINRALLSGTPSQGLSDHSRPDSGMGGSIFAPSRPPTASAESAGLGIVLVSIL